MSETIDLVFNPDDLTLGDLEDFEDYTGKTIDEAIKPVPVLDDEGKRTFDEKGRPVMQTKISPKSITCLVWIMRRKAFPGFTIADARNVRVGALVITSEDSGDSGNA